MGSSAISRRNKRRYNGKRKFRDNQFTASFKKIYD